jgi:hypothetical protein
MRAVVAFAVLALLAPRAGADVVTVLAGRDVTLYENVSGNVANGAGESIFAGRTGPNNQNLLRRAIVFFNVAGSVPAGATVTGVSLQLSQTLSRGTPTPFTLHRATANWGEGTSNAGLPGGAGTASTNDDATWIHTFFPGSFWATPGGDFAAAASATTTVGTATGPYTWSSAQMAADVQTWLTSPATNFGWFLRGNEVTGPDASRFGSRENASAALRPVLTVTFTPVPEPSALVLAGVAAAGWATRRRARRRA